MTASVHAPSTTVISTVAPTASGTLAYAPPQVLTNPGEQAAMALTTLVRRSRRLAILHLTLAVALAALCIAVACWQRGRAPNQMIEATLVTVGVCLVTAGLRIGAMQAYAFLVQQLRAGSAGALPLARMLLACELVVYLAILLPAGLGCTFILQPVVYFCANRLSVDTGDAMAGPILLVTALHVAMAVVTVVFLTRTLRLVRAAWRERYA